MSRNECFLYRERPVNEWTGPYKVIGIDEKQGWINVGGRLSLVSVDKVKEYKPSSSEAALQSRNGGAQEQQAETSPDVEEL